MRSLNEKQNILLAMLFASPESVPLERLAEVLETDIPLTRNLLEDMAELYKSSDAGIQLQEIDGAYRICTNPAYYPYVQKLLQRKPRAAFSQTVLETLALIVFKQPITRGVIESIRGINSDYAVNKLVEYRLVEEVGRLDAPGRPLLFGTSEEFLIFYGLKNLDEILTSTEPMALLQSIEEQIGEGQLTIESAELS